MASYNELLALIDAYINQNGVQAITGQVLNGVLRAMVDQLGRGYSIMGAADPTTDPGTPDGPETWFASVPGTYTNFDGIQIVDGELALLSYEPSTGFSKNTIYEGFQTVQATIDGNVGTPAVGVSYANGILSFDFHNMKGVTGDPAGFGAVTASVDGNIGTPSVQVQTSGPDTAKAIAFQFHNLKGETGVTSVLATVDNTSGNPQCAVSLNGQQLVLNFTGLKGAQGDTGSSVDYPFTIVNNLTTNDPAQALSAAMGVQLESEVSQLEAKVDDLIEDLSEVTTTQTEILTTDADGYLDGYYIGTNKRVSSSSPFRIWYKLLNEETTINYDNTETSSGVAYSSAIPVGQAYADELIKYGKGTGSAVVPAGKYLWWSAPSATPAKTRVYKEAEVVGDLKDFVVRDEIPSMVEAEVESNDTIKGTDAYTQSRLMIEDLLQRGDVFSPMLVDWMQCVHGINGMTNVSQMQVISATEGSITLTENEAASFHSATPAVVGFSDGTYKVVYFEAYSGSGSVVIKYAWDTTDLSNATTLQSLHDTVEGGAGIHLSPSGYLALAQFTAQEISSIQSQKDKNLIAGLNFYNASEDGNNIKDINGNIIATLSKTMETTGGTDGSLKSCSIRTAVSAFGAYSFGWSVNAFAFLQGGTAGLYAEFTMPASGTGFVEVQGALLNGTGNRTGGVMVEVFADGVSQGAQSFTFCQKRLLFSGVTAKKNIKVRFTLDSANPTQACIYGINFWRMPSDITAVDLTGKKVAVLGDSWTQFPIVGTGLSDHESFNEIVVRPDGTQGNGYGYFPKELARITGASVDNWGKSNMRTDNWGLPMIDTILAHDDYDYLIVEFFINDHNGGVSVSQWAKNISKICRKCYSAGVRPIVICACRTNSATTNADYWSKMFRGVGVI